MNMTRDLPVSDADSGSDDEPHSLFDVEQFADAIEHEILSTSSIARTGKVLEVIGTLVKVAGLDVTVHDAGRCYLPNLDNTVEVMASAEGEWHK